MPLDLTSYAGFAVGDSSKSRGPNPYTLKANFQGKCQILKGSPGASAEVLRACITVEGFRGGLSACLALCKTDIRPYETRFSYLVRLCACVCVCVNIGFWTLVTFVFVVFDCFMFTLLLGDEPQNGLGSPAGLRQGYPPNKHSAFPKGWSHSRDCLGGTWVTNIAFRGLPQFGIRSTHPSTCGIAYRFLLGISNLDL